MNPVRAFFESGAKGPGVKIINPGTIQDPKPTAIHKQLIRDQRVIAIREAEIVHPHLVLKMSP